MSDLIFDLQRFATGTSGNDNLTASYDGEYVYAYGGNDNIYNYWYGSIRVYADNGNDYVFNDNGNTATLYGGNGNDTLWNQMTYSASYGRNVFVDGETGKDVIINFGNNATLNGGSGDDSIENWGVAYNTNSTFSDIGKNVKINGGSGNDVIKNAGDNATIDGGSGNDTLNNGFDSNGSYGARTSINGGSGNDVISLSGSRYGVTVRGGTGNDKLYGNTSTVNGVQYQLFSGEGYDTIYNWNSNDTLNLGGAYYTRSTVGSNVVISLTSGDAVTLSGAKGKPVNIIKGTLAPVSVTLTNYNNNTTVNGKSGNDTIENKGNYVTINAGAGNDSIRTEGYNSNIIINSGNGNDTIYNGVVDYVSIYSGADNDSINNYSAWYSTVNAGDGSDTIIVSGRAWQDSINGGAGNDKISLGTSLDANNGQNTIVGGSGNDTIYGNPNATVGNVYQFYSGDGYDIINNWNSNDTLNLGGAKYTRSTVSGNVVISLTSGDAVTLSGASGKPIDIINGTLAGGKNIDNSKSNVALTGTDYADTITNSGSNVTIKTYGGDDSINLQFTNSNKVTVDAGSGADTITAQGYYLSVVGGSGRDSIDGHHNYGTIYGGADSDTIVGNHWRSRLNGDGGNDLISITDYWYNTISGGAGADTIALTGGGEHSINGGADNDRISLGSATNSTIFYASGSGNDTVWSFNSTDVLSIDGSYNSPKKSGNDVRVNVGSGSILLKDAVTFGSININGKNITIGEDKTITQQDVIKTFMATLDKYNTYNAKTALDYAVKEASNGKYKTIDEATTAMVNDCKYSTSSDAFLKNYCGINLDNSDTGAISGADAGGTLKTATSIILESGTKYSLDMSQYKWFNNWHDNKDSGLDVWYSDVGYLTDDKQQIMDCVYTWWAPEATKLIEESYGYSFNDSNAQYKKLYLKFENSGDFLAYTNTYRDGLTITINLGYYKNFQSNDYNGTCTDPSTNEILSAGYYLDRTFTHEMVHAIMRSKLKNFGNLPQFITEGTAELIHGIDDARDSNIKNLANDYTYLNNRLKNMNRGTGDTASYAAGYMFLRWLAKQSATATDYSGSASAVTTTQKKIPTGVNENGTTMTITTKFTGKSINMNEYETKDGNEYHNADASTLTKAISIFGNKNNNLIKGGSGADYLAGGAGNDIISGNDGDDTLSGGSGNDSLNGGAGKDSLYSGSGNNTLTGGSGDDMFIYESGKLLITDYAAGDKIKIASDKITKTTVTSGNVIFTTSSGSITVSGGEGKSITLIDNNINETTKKYGSTGDKTLTVTKNVTLGSSYQNADGSKLTKSVQIVGNEQNNSIKGGSGNDSISGLAGDDKITAGNGKDTLTGGYGKDLLYGQAGDDKIYGQAGNDSLYGGSGNDSLWGGVGNDWLKGGLDNDWLKGGDGNDTFIYGDGDGKDIITGFENGDLLQITGTFSTSYNSSKREIYFKVGSTDKAITLTDFTATTFHVNNDTYQISGNKFVKK